MTKTITLVLADNSKQQFATIKTLLAKAEVGKAPALLHYYDVQQQAQLPIAAITGLADNLTTSQGVWLRADPVELRTDINSAYFFGQRSLQFDDERAQQIARDIAPLFDDYKATLHVASAYHWYLQLPYDPGIHSSAPATLLGQSVRDYLQEAEVTWRKLFTELQMALQLSPANQQLPTPITALWFWGGGCLPKLEQSGWQSIVANDSLSRGLASLLKIPYLRLNEASELADNALWVLNASDDVEPIIEKLQLALKQQRLTMLTIYKGGDSCHQIQAKSLAPWWQFWHH